MIEIKKVLEFIKEEEWLENDERHTDSFRNGIKLAHKILKDKLFSNKLKQEDKNG